MEQQLLAIATLPVLIKYLPQFTEAYSTMLTLKTVVDKGVVIKITLGHLNF